MLSISSLVLLRARSAVDIVQEQIKTQSDKLSKQIEALLGMRLRHHKGSWGGGLNPTTDICPPLGLPLGEEHPGTIIRRSERLAARTGPDGTTTERLLKRPNPLGMVWIFESTSPFLLPFFTSPDNSHTPRDGVYGRNITPCKRILLCINGKGIS